MTYEQTVHVRNDTFGRYNTRKSTLLFTVPVCDHCVAEEQRKLNRSTHIYVALVIGVILGIALGIALDDMPWYSRIANGLLVATMATVLLSMGLEKVFESIYRKKHPYKTIHTISEHPIVSRFSDEANRRYAVKGLLFKTTSSAFVYAVKDSFKPYPPDPKVQDPKPVPVIKTNIPAYSAVTPKPCYPEEIISPEEWKAFLTPLYESRPRFLRYLLNSGAKINEENVLEISFPPMTEAQVRWFKDKYAQELREKCKDQFICDDVSYKYSSIDHKAID